MRQSTTPRRLCDPAAEFHGRKRKIDPVAFRCRGREAAAKGLDLRRERGQLDLRKVSGIDGDAELAPGAVAEDDAMERLRVEELIGKHHASAAWLERLAEVQRSHFAERMGHAGEHAAAGLGAELDEVEVLRAYRARSLAAAAATSSPKTVPVLVAV
jgi:hypothetical protein